MSSAAFENKNHLQALCCGYPCPRVTIMVNYAENDDEWSRMMRAVIQRVQRAQMRVKGEAVREIGAGLVVFLGVMRGDTEKQAAFLAQKVCELRIFTDDADKMNLSLVDVGGDMLIVSNFTLSADCKKGRRPSFDASAPPGEAERLYDEFVALVRRQPVKTVHTGTFGAHMDVWVENDGPVTIVIDTERIGK